MWVGEVPMPATAPLPDALQVWAELMDGNRRFVAGTLQARDLVRERQAAATARHPKAMLLACSDSRVVPDMIFDQRVGDLFVVRVAGNTADALGIGSIEYAAEHLGASLLVVLGHQECAAVRIACSGEKLASPHLKAVIKAVRNSFPADQTPGTNPEDLRRAEKQNARFVARTLLDRSELLHRRVAEGDLSVVPAHYMLDSGVVERL
jgi:carbonic anhydrase